MEIIDEFLIQYNKQYDFYSELARIGYLKLESELAKRGIKAIVSHRAKRPDRLRDKLIQRNEEKKYSTVKSIFEDIVDLAGVRIALYFPSDREIVDETVNDLFDVKKTKKFPESSHKPKYTKRFSGYWASHYRVEIKKSDKQYKRYQNTIFEIQVASVLMHAWAEVEHDLVYKPLSGGLSEEELAILDEINGLVLSGEIALERLQKAIKKRSEESNEIGDRYELTNYIVNSLNKNYLNKLKLGDTKALNNYFKTIYNTLDTNTLSKYIKNVNQSVDETISDQLLNMFIQDSFKSDLNEKSMKEYFSRIIGPNKDSSGFESFIKTWIILEKAFNILNEESGISDKTRKYNVPRFDNLFKMNFLNKQEVYEIQKFRQIRNQLLHGIETHNDNFLNDVYLRLKGITEKLISQIKDEKLRVELGYELGRI
jgi:ppGpp synthetase/RelA/SpoT-type nucleotidyltranferase